MKHVKLAVAAMLSLSAFASVAENLVGRWVYDAERSVDERPEESRGSIFGSVAGGVSIGGFPIPGTGGGSGGETVAGDPRDPDVLYCQKLAIVEIDDYVNVTYDNLGMEKFVPGKHLGRKTRWNGKRLSQSYETTSRKVSRTFELNDAGELEITVKINPTSGQTRTYKRIFQRIPAANS